MTANPKLSPDGQHVLSHGGWNLWLDGELLMLFGQPLGGIHPGWLTDRVIAYLSAPEGDDLVGGFLTEYRGPDVAPRRLSSVRFNAIAMGGGHWAGTHTATRTTYTSRGDVAQDTYCPAISPDGSKWACLTGNNSPVHDLLVNGVRVASGEIDDKLSIANDGAVVFSLFVSGIQQTYGMRNNGGPVLSLKATWDRYEVDPVVVLLPNGEHWVISHDDTRTLVRPWGSTWGYALQGAKTPHAAWNASTNRLRVVGDMESRLLDVSLDLSAPRIDLSRRPDQPVDLEPITRPCWWGGFKAGSRFDPSGAWRSQPWSWAHCEDATTAQEAIANGLAPVCSVDVALSAPAILANCAAIWCQGPQGQGGDVDAVGRECRRALVLLAEDDRPTRPPILAYVDDALPTGYPASADWIALQCYADSTEDVAAAGRRFRAVLALSPEKPTVLIVQAWDRRTTADGQGQPIAKVEALQALWPQLVNEDSRIVGALAFAWGRAGGGVAHPSVAQMQKEIASSIPGVPEIVTIRDEEEPIDPPGPPRVTITDWQPRTGPAPLMVRMTMERSGGPATLLTAFADGRRPFVINNPPRISEVTFAFDQPGTYAIGAKVEGPGGSNQTSTQRFVTVTEGEDMAVQFPPRNETKDFVDKHLEPHYKDVLKESARNTHVNSEGYSVWIEGYLRRRVNGMTHEKAVADTMREIKGEPEPNPR